MELIAELADYIEDEIADAKKYARHAIRLQDRKPDIAKLFYNLSTEELGHMDRAAEVYGILGRFKG